MIIYQLHRQHKSNQKLQKENLKEQLKLEIFNNFSEKIKFSEDSFSKIFAKLNSIVLNCESNHSLQSQGVKPIYISDRINHYHEAHFKFAESLQEIIFISEKYIIADEIFQIFCLAFQAGSYDLNKTFEKLNDTLTPMLPYDRVILNNCNQTVIPSSILHRDIKNLKMYSESYKNTLEDIHCYIYDLKIEIQNLLLGNVFENKVKPRKQLHNDYIVISKEHSKSIEQLEEYFLDNTKWGKIWKESKTKHQGGNNTPKKTRPATRGKDSA